MCAMVKVVAIVGDGRPPTFNRNPYNGYINPYYWVDDHPRHPLLYGNNGSLDPGTCNSLKVKPLAVDLSFAKVFLFGH